MKVYTRTGDKGKSSLANGQRLKKSELVFDILGTLDELNSHLGWICLVTDEKVRAEILHLQDNIFRLGTIVAQSYAAKFDFKTEVIYLEIAIDKYQGIFGEDWYSKFILPGGTEAAARTDITRSICRRCERLVVKLNDEKLHEVQKYLNRMSDYLFVLRCYLNWLEKYQEQQFIN